MIKLVAYIEMPTPLVTNETALGIVQAQAVVIAGKHGMAIGQRAIGPAETDGMSVVVWDLADVRGLA